MMIMLDNTIQITEWLDPEDPFLEKLQSEINKDFPNTAIIESEIISKYYDKVWDQRIQSAVFIRNDHYHYCLEYVRNKCRIKSTPLFAVNSAG